MMSWSDGARPDCGGFTVDPVCLDLPFDHALRPALVPAEPGGGSGRGPGRFGLFPGAGLSVALHAAVIVLCLALPASLHFPVHVVSIELIPGMASGPLPAGPGAGRGLQPESDPSVRDVGGGVSEGQPAVAQEVELDAPPPVQAPPAAEAVSPARKKDRAPERKSVQRVARTPQEVRPVADAKEPAPLNATSVSDVAVASGVPHGGSLSGMQVGPSGAGPVSPGGTGGGMSSGPVHSRFGASDGPRFVQRVMPRYPDFARRTGREGMVVLRLTIGESGDLQGVDVVEGGGHGFDDAAIAAVRASTFAPATRFGQGVACSALLPVRFALKGS